MHVVHNVFKAGLTVYGSEAEEMAFNLHQWFKSSPCKHEDFMKLEENTQLDSSLLCGIFQENASQSFYQQSEAQKDC